MKNIIILIIIILVGSWFLQNYTSFKAIDYAKNYLQKIDWSNLKLFFVSSERLDPERRLNVFIRDGLFVPNYNELALGAKVTWINEDTKTHAVSGDGWGSPEIAPGKAWSKTFDVAGTYKYRCSFHPTVKGEIIVK